MPERIDHVIFAAADLTQLEAAFTRLGFHVVGGGEHPHLGTRNRIIVLDQGYIELLAIADEETVSPAVRERIARAPGWIGFALQSADIAAEAAAMRARGADVRGPMAGRLVAPNGRVRSWQTVTIGGDDLFSVAEPVPFLIQHDSTGEQHLRELAGTDAIEPHPNGAQRLQAVVVAIASLSAAQEIFARDYGLLAPNPGGEVPTLAAEAQALPLPAPGERVVPAEPLGAGIASDRLASAGEGVCCVSVGVANLAATREYLQRQGITYHEWDAGLMIPADVTGGGALAFVHDIPG